MVSGGTIPRGTSGSDNLSPPPADFVSGATTTVSLSTTIDSSLPSQFLSSQLSSSVHLPAAISVLQSLLSPPYNLSPKDIGDLLTQPTPPALPSAIVAVAYSSAAALPSSFPLLTPPALPSVVAADAYSSTAALPSQSPSIAAAAPSFGISAGAPLSLPPLHPNHSICSILISLSLSLFSRKP